MAEANESPGDALVREVAEELGIVVRVSRLLALDWIGPHGPWDGQIVFLFDTEVLMDDVASNLEITDKEISDSGFFSLQDAKRHLRGDVAERLERAARATDANLTAHPPVHRGSDRVVHERQRRS